MADEDYDLCQRRCPRLGGPVTFHYCRQSGDEGRSCFKVLDCWWEYFDVVAFCKEALPPEEFSRLMHSRPQPKVSSLLEFIEQARKRSG